MSTARLFGKLNPWPLWESAKNTLPLKKIQLTWDFIDTVCLAGFEWGGILTDIFIADAAIFTASTFFAGMSIGVVLAYCEFLAHSAQNDLIDPDEEDAKLLAQAKPVLVELSALQKLIIATETITHTSEKATGATLALRTAVTYLSTSYPEFRKYDRLAKGAAHVIGLTGAFFGSGQEAKNIELAFKRQNQLAQLKSKMN